MSPQSQNPADDQNLGRRAKTRNEEDSSDNNVKFVSRQLSEERLAALREFIRHARTDEILQIRRLYGDNREVLAALGLEHLD